MKRIRNVVQLMLTIAVLATTASAQVATGIPPFSSIGGGPFDSVNLGNLNVSFAIPIVSKPGRGIPFSFALAYNSSIWNIGTTSGHPAWVPVSIGTTPTWGWQGLGASFVPYLSYSAAGFVYFCGPNNQMSYTEAIFNNFAYHDQFGGRHAMNFSGWIISNSPGPTYNCAANGSGSSGTGIAIDGSGYAANTSIPPGINGTGAIVTTASGGTISTPIVQDGIQPSLANYTIQDANGNQISFNASNGQFTDTMGSAVLTITGTNPITYTYAAPGGSPHYTVNYANYNIRTNFACSGIAEYTSTGTVPLVSSIAQPDGTSYSFSYEATPGNAGYYTGRIASVTLPTGGTIAYQYPTLGGNGGLSCVDGSTKQVNRVLTPGGTWVYSRNQVSGSEWSTTTLTPTNDYTAIYFQQDQNTGNYYETQRTVNQGGSTPLLTTTTCYNGNSNNCTTTAVSAPISRKSVTLQYPNNGLASKVDTFYNANYALLTETDQYAYGAGGTPGSLLRKTQIAYANLGTIIDRPASVTVTDGTNLLSKTTYAYDEFALQAPGGTTPQHASVSGSRGNVTTITSTIIGTTTISKQFKYFDTGKVYQTIDSNGATTTYNYADATSTCGNAFPTSVTPAIASLATSMTWNCSGGVALSATDANGSQTITNYSDPNFWRPASIIAPYTSTTSTTTSFTYTPYNTTTGAFAHTDSQMPVNSGNSIIEQLSTVNQFGQPVYSQQREGPSSSNWDSGQVLHDSFLRPTQNSMPCVYTSTSFTAENQACPSSATTTSTLDALGRVTKTTDGGTGFVQYTYTQNDVETQVGPLVSNENLKTKQLEYDALGRLTSVCEVTNLSGYVQCGQTNALNGYFTTYAYGVNGSGYPTTTVTQGPAGSQQTRIYTYDLLGRLVSEQNPESGTTTYTYDSGASNCPGAFIGDVVQRKDAANHVRCYTYDAMHRLTSITYPGTTTDSRYFVYDGATVNQATMQNAKGRLAEAYTCPSSGSCNPPKTDIGFSYSPRGEITDAYESTPNSSGYYHTSASYWENGVLQNLMNTIAGLPNVSYGVDPAGRPATATATTNH